MKIHTSEAARILFYRFKVVRMNSNDNILKISNYLKASVRLKKTFKLTQRSSIFSPHH